MALLSRGNAGFLSGLGQGYLQGRQNQQQYRLAQQAQDTARMQAINEGLLPSKQLAALTAQNILSTITDPERFATIRDQGLLPFLSDMVNGLGQTAQNGDWSHVTGLDPDKLQRTLDALKAPGRRVPYGGNTPGGGRQIMPGSPSVVSTPDEVPSPPDVSISGGELPASTIGGPPRPLNETVRSSFPNTQLADIPALLTAPEQKGIISTATAPDFAASTVPQTGPTQAATTLPFVNNQPGTTAQGAPPTLADLFTSATPRDGVDAVPTLADLFTVGNKRSGTRTTGPTLGAGGTPSALPPSVALKPGQDVYNQNLGYKQLPANLQAELQRATPGSVEVDLAPKIGPSIVNDPTNPINNTISTLSRKVEDLVNTIPGFDTQKATEFAYLYGNTVMNDPGYLQATESYYRAVDAGGYSPNMLSALRNQMYGSFANAETNASTLLSTLISPYITSASIARSAAATLKDLGETVQSAGNAVEKVNTAALSKGAQQIEATRAGAEVTTAGAAASKADTEAKALVETATHNARQEDIDQAKPLVDRIQSRLSMREMQGNSWSFNFGAGGGVAGLANVSANVGQRQAERESNARTNTRNQIGDILALRNLGIAGNSYASALSNGFLQAARAEYFADPSSWSAIPPTDQVLRGLDYNAQDIAGQSAIRRSVQGDRAATQRLAEDINAATKWQKDQQINLYEGSSSRVKPETQGSSTTPAGTAGTPGSKTAPILPQVPGTPGVAPNPPGKPTFFAPFAAGPSSLYKPGAPPKGHRPPKR
jgi:ribosomal protein L22